MWPVRCIDGELLPHECPQNDVSFFYRFAQRVRFMRRVCSKNGVNAIESRDPSLSATHLVFAQLDCRERKNAHTSAGFGKALDYEEDVLDQTLLASVWFILESRLSIFCVREAINYPSLALRVDRCDEVEITGSLPGFQFGPKSGLHLCLTSQCC
jgi:hypothetical protein